MAWTDLKERDVSRQVSDFLGYRGWRRIRNQVGVTTNMAGNTFRFGEKGMPDLMFLRYVPAHQPWTMVLWIETKRNKGGRLSEHQIAWQDGEKILGALVINVECFEKFAEWYERELGWIHSAAGPDVPGNLGLFAGDRSPPE